MAWEVSDYEVNSCILSVDGVEVTTGTAVIYYFRDEDGSIEYLQSGAASVGASRYDFTATHTPNLGWTHELLVDSVMLDSNWTWVLIHSVYGEIATGTEFVATSASGGGAGGIKIGLR